MAIALHLQGKIRNTSYKATVLINFLIGAPTHLSVIDLSFLLSVRPPDEIWQAMLLWFQETPMPSIDNGKAYNYYSCKKFDQPN